MAISARKGGRGPSGIAKVKVLPDKGKVGVKFAPNQERDDLPAKVVLPLDNCPAWVRSGDFKVGLSADLTRMTFITPLEGLAQAKFIGFGRREDGSMWIDTVQSKWSDFDVFRAYFEIVQPKEWEGMRVAHRFRFYLEQDPEQPTTTRISKDPDRSDYAKVLKQFLDYTGAADKPILWTADPQILLEEIEKRALRGRPVTLTLRDGWVVDINPVLGTAASDAGGEDLEAEFDDEFDF